MLFVLINLLLFVLVDILLDMCAKFQSPFEVMTTLVILMVLLSYFTVCTLPTDVKIITHTSECDSERRKRCFSFENHIALRIHLAYQKVTLVFK